MDSLPQENFVQAVQTSCRDFIKDGPIKISQEKITQFLASLEQTEYKKLSEDISIRLPVRFSSVDEEVNFIATIDLLNFGSGYRKELHEAVDRGAFDTIRYGVMAMHIGGVPMDAAAWKDMDVYKVAELFQFPIEREVRHETLDFVTLTEPTSLKALAVGIMDVLNSTGRYLAQHNYKDLGMFLLKKAGERPHDAGYLVEQLVRAFEGLQDCYTIEGRRVCLFKKAQILVYHLWLSLRDRVELFDFTDIDQLTIFADNVIPTLLVHLGILEVPQEWLEPQELSEAVATSLRAASVVACQSIVTASDGLLTTGGLDVYLWRLAKVGAYRDIPRFQLKNTVMF